MLSERRVANTYTILLLHTMIELGGKEALIAKLKAGKFDKLRSGISRVDEAKRLDRLAKVLDAALESPEARVLRRHGILKD